MSENKPMTIIEFLEARIAEDEKFARAASHQKVAGPFHGNWRHDSLHLSGMEREDAVHIARNDPARVLAECAAKRAIIADHADMVEAFDSLGQLFPGGLMSAEVDAPWRTKTLYALAAVYADHPDYQQEWAL